MPVAKKNIILITLFSIILSYNSSYPKIYKKIHKDGTIEYYNNSEYKENSGKKLDLRSEYDLLIEQISKNSNIDPYLIKCIIKVESDFNPDAVSVAGAMGLMQLMQSTARYYDVQDPLDPEENLNAGIRHFKNLMDYFKNDIPLALAAYHAGLGKVKKRMSIPPIKSTIDYVNRVMFLYNGKKDYSYKVKKLYKKIDKDGDIIIFSK